MTQAPVCILCHSSETTLMQEGARHAPEVQVRRCTGCGFVFLWPRPTEGELNEYYTHDYRADYTDPPAEEQYKLDLNEARQRVARMLPLLNSKTRLLEIGSGAGAFLDQVRVHCGTVTGVEPHNEYRQTVTAMSGVPLAASLEELEKDFAGYDVVTMFHVLEHIANPIGFLRQVRRLMSKNGILCIEVPNIDDILVAVYKIPAYLEFYYQKAHLHYYSAATLGKVIEDAGFEVTVNGIQRYDLSNHVRWMLTGEPGGHGYYHDILAPRANTGYEDALIRSGYQDTLWAIARNSQPNQRGDE